MWRVEYEPDSSRLTVRVCDRLTQRDVRDLSAALEDALTASGGATFRALFDLRDLVPLEEDVVERFRGLKQRCLRSEACQGLVVLASSPTIAMQQHHTRVGSSSEVEVVTADPREAVKFVT